MSVNAVLLHLAEQFLFIERGQEEFFLTKEVGSLHIEIIDFALLHVFVHDGSLEEVVLVNFLDPGEHGLPLESGDRSQRHERSFKLLILLLRDPKAHLSINFFLKFLGNLDVLVKFGETVI